jgi:hypothetical protein
MAVDPHPEEQYTDHADLSEDSHKQSQKGAPVLQHVQRELTLVFQGRVLQSKGSLTKSFTKYSGFIVWMP